MSAVTELFTYSATDLSSTSSDPQLDPSEIETRSLREFVGQDARLFQFFERTRKVLPSVDTRAVTSPTAAIASPVARNLVFSPTRTLNQVASAYPKLIPAWRTALEAEIHESTWMLALEDDWDGEGSPRITNATWKRAAHELRRLADRCAAAGHSLPIPKISPNGHGSIDVYWSKGNRKMLLNVPESGDDAIPMSGIENGWLVISEYLDSPDKLDRLIEFLSA